MAENDPVTTSDEESPPTLSEILDANPASEEVKRILDALGPDWGPDHARLLFELMTWGHPTKESVILLCAEGNAYRQYRQAVRKGNLERVVFNASFAFARLFGLGLWLPRWLQNMIADPNNEVDRP